MKKEALSNASAPPHPRHSVTRRNTAFLSQITAFSRFEARFQPESHF
jgi:hypothetical protein